MLTWDMRHRQQRKSPLNELLQPLQTYFDSAPDETTPGLHQGEDVRFAADEERKAAVVQAFKVCPFSCAFFLAGICC